VAAAAAFAATAHWVPEISTSGKRDFAAPYAATASALVRRAIYITVFQELVAQPPAPLLLSPLLSCTPFF